MKKYKSRYERGVTCGVCGRKLEPGDAYTIYPKDQDKAICLDCDVDRHIPQKNKEE
jgi:hypothetical protein